MAIHKHFVPNRDATVVSKLRAPGTVLLGKLQMTEGAYADHYPSIPPPLSPWHPDHWVGASSSGSGVATAAGLCYGSLGSDTGGSIRVPSAANRVTGLKPTRDRVSRYGVYELAPTLDHIGPMTHSAADAAAMLGAIAGADPDDPTASQALVPNYLAEMPRGLHGVRVAVDQDWNTAGVHPEVARAVERALAVIVDLGAEIRTVRLPNAEAVITD